MSIPELSVQIKNAPGQLVQITTILAEANVNIRGIAASSAGKIGWVRLLVDQAKIAEEALEECGITADIGEALAIIITHEPGTLDRALRLLSDEKINVDYIYTIGGQQPSGKYIAIMGVQTPGKAEKLLIKNGIELADLPHI